MKSLKEDYELRLKSTVERGEKEKKDHREETVRMNEELGTMKDIVVRKGAKLLNKIRSERLVCQVQDL